MNTLLKATLNHVTPMFQPLFPLKPHKTVIEGKNEHLIRLNVSQNNSVEIIFMRQNQVGVNLTGWKEVVLEDIVRRQNKSY